MTPVVRNLDLVAPDRPAHQHSTMVDKFPLVSVVQHDTSQSPDGSFGVWSLKLRNVPAQFALEPLCAPLLEPRPTRALPRLSHFSLSTPS
ncbi:BZ3500_MvSof-1268-A1-R1_Chr6-2g08550 [Microbotryum saponariae]|uniref:BZ3500_MvSof-1268-A1-R1_Chr6-2g08550 protein n=1 Tax=Microbotryum saponariae TaxID=289078 RepID=A0A2X0KIM3_9BASI|nr:BZ3500_MvSof-1268-A1-R1_Chr6-2g08550 [Microbotryum saponariae]SDA07827.1 BZ3501_MvSof-1269-A2-R1_Chr6-1g08264 [Microbotryum saponariae]